MLIAGIHTLTLLDYPGKTACIIFTAGCNFRCGFCHNPQFVLPEEILNYQEKGLVPEEKFFKFLKTRKGLLDGVVVSGGEPTIQPDLVPFLKKIKEMGFLVKLDTNGTNAKVIEECIREKCVDYFAMDIKASPKNYDILADTKVDTPQIEKSKDLIMNSGVDYEFRTTVIAEFHDEAEMEKIVQFIKGAKKFTIQNFRNKKVLNPEFHKYTGFSKKELTAFKKIAEKYVSQVEVME